MKQRIVIIGIGFASRLCLIRSLAQMDAEIIVVVVGHSKFKPIDCYSKYVNHVYYCKGNNKRKLLEIINEKCYDENRRVILLPINDFAASVIDQNIDSLKGRFLFPHIHNEQGAITAWMNKEKQKELARSLGIDTAYSNNIEISDGKYVLPSGINYPCFTKTRAYITGYKNTLHRCDNEKELQETLRKIGERYRQITIMVEDYKAIEKEYAVVGVSDGNDVIIPGVIEIITMAQGSDKGVACQGKIMPIIGFEELIELFKEFMRTIGFVGLFDIDFYYCDGKFYFGEINLRIGGSGYAVIQSGVNLPLMLVKVLLGQSIDNMEKTVKRSATFVNERICLDNWYEGYFSTKEFHKILNSADISFVKDEKDKRPEKIFRREIAIKSIKRQLKKCLKKR